MMRIAYMGPGTFSEESTKRVLDDRFKYVPYRLITEAFQSIVKGETDFVVIPIENTIEGSVNMHMDWLVHEVDFPIQAEWIYPVEMNLIGWPSAGSTEGSSLDFSHIRKIVTYPIAYAQCRDFLRMHLPDVEFGEAGSTADGVRMVMEAQDPALAAIGPSVAAERYQVPILAQKIQDHHNNYTRFVLAGTHAPDLPPSNLQKTTILVTLPEDYPGGLHQVLSAFAWRRINLSKIESRPTKKRLGNYYFYIDIEDSIHSVLLSAALEEIRAIGCQVRVLGSYPSFLVGANSQ